MNELLDALGYIGSSLDKPGRAVRGILGGRPDEAAAFVPFSDSMGLTDPSHAVSGEDLIKQNGLSTGTSWGDSLLGFGTEAALDPTTYLGGFLGRIGGKALGKGMEAAARVRGPGYATSGNELLAKLTGLADKSHGADVLASVGAENPDLFSRVAQEIHPMSTVLGAGDEAVAFKSPAGRVTRLGWNADGAAGRPVSPNVLQADRAVDFPVREVNPGLGQTSFRVENLPAAERVGDVPFWTRTPMGPGGMPGTIAMKKATAGEGLRFADAHAGNLGLVGSVPKIIDPGAVSVEKSFAGGFQPVDQAGRPGLLMRALLDAAGGQDAMKLALDAGRSAPGYERGGAIRGLGLGAMTPSAFRTQR